ncbi:DUF2622 domain-containing protein [Yersinia enterocolitica]|uniref:hypothetical protein n=1 Tax=Yersinia enterocolitica TaxID=630 RepID=UPI0005DBFEDA|nr:hypothetical protein [Yersinia enterocolitica]EKN6388242.1 DUF2622 domain-containing protein [Yersinia enterocolitica]ELW8957849.1 DUF2622 domain-containing protein [Yersinia enterocolitica]CNH66129.1 phage protein [Yersinia enterocolitica]CNL89561.1 phage protein [Yersinia enterocolitica]HEI6714801.1 DUF2622 domain-containing protein [Yersinia enterocolitica]
MAKFIVRIELRDSKPEDYDELHEKMERHGFYKIASFPRDSSFYKLPHAEYIFYPKNNNENIYYVAYLAKETASRIRANPMVLASEVTNLFQLGLDKVQ